MSLKLAMVLDHRGLCVKRLTYQRWAHMGSIKHYSQILKENFMWIQEDTFLTRTTYFTLTELELCATNFLTERSK